MLKHISAFIFGLVVGILLWYVFNWLYLIVWLLNEVLWYIGQVPQLDTDAKYERWFATDIMGMD